MFSALGFLLGRTIAERRTSDSQAINQAGLLGGIAGLTPMGILLVQNVVDKAVESQPAVSTTSVVSTATWLPYLTC